MSNSERFQGCYVFKSRLQEYAQKVGLTIPVYETIKEGPSHEPKFRSTVIVNDVRYDSLPGFFNRKAAEHSAAEVALIELAKLDEGDKSITMPVHQTGLCKNLLQEYAQKMNFAVPNYECRKEEKSGVRHLFSCTVDVGGIKYIGATAGTKKEAEIKAARTALLAIRSTDSGPNENLNSNSTYTVVPGRKTGTASTQEAAAAALKPKKGKFKKNPRRNRRVGARGLIQANNVPDSLLSVDGNGGQPSAQASEVVVQTSDPAVLSQEAIMKVEYQRPTVNGNDQAHNVPDSLLSVDGNGGQPSAQANVVVVQTSDPAVVSQEAIMKLDDQRPTVNGNEGFAYSTDDAFASHHNIDYDPSGGQLTVFNHNQDIAASHGEISLSNIGDDQGYGVEQAACLVNNPPMCLGEVPRVVDGMN